MIDIPYEIRAGSKKFKVFHEIGSGIPVIQMNRILPHPFLGQGWREGGLHLFNFLQITDLIKTPEMPPYYP